MENTASVGEMISEFCVGGQKLISSAAMGSSLIFVRSRIRTFLPLILVVAPIACGPGKVWCGREGTPGMAEVFNIGGLKTSYVISSDTPVGPCLSQISPFLLSQQPLELALLLPDLRFATRWSISTFFSVSAFFYLPAIESKQPPPSPQKQQTQCPSEVLVHLFFIF